MRICVVCEENKPHRGNQLICLDCMKKTGPNGMKDYYKGRMIFKKYGITLGDYYDMMFNQSGKCKICDKPSNGTKLAIDHCHKTGKIRGLLCVKCNALLGLAGDSKETLNNAIKYLEDAKNFTLRSRSRRDLEAVDPKGIG